MNEPSPADFWCFSPSTPEGDAEIAVKARGVGLPEHFVRELAPLAPEFRPSPKGDT